MIRVERRDDVQPICPHCKESLEEVWFRELAGMFGKRYLYFCSRCRQALGVSHRKGFWMG